MIIILQKIISFLHQSLLIFSPLVIKQKRKEQKVKINHAC